METSPRPAAAPAPIAPVMSRRRARSMGRFVEDSLDRFMLFLQKLLFRQTQPDSFKLHERLAQSTHWPIERRVLSTLNITEKFRHPVSNIFAEKFLLPG